MWKIFDIVPGVVWAALCGALLLAAGFSYVRMKDAQADLSSYRAEVAENTRKAESEARAKEQAMQATAERIANEAAKKETVLVSRAAATERAARSLRDDIERLNARPAPEDASAASISREASAARELLGTCSERYSGVARSADQLRDQVSGLQEFHRTIAEICSGGKATN